jgi:hypothetical protein
MVGSIHNQRSITLKNLIPVALITLISISTSAQNTEFATNKTKTLEAIEKRISGLQEMKTCISTAADGPAMKECRKKHRQAMMSLSMEMEEGRHERRMHKLKNQRDQKDQTE